MNVSICLLLSLFALICMICFTLLGSFANISTFKKVDQFFEWSHHLNQVLIQVNQSNSPYKSK